MMDKLKYSEVPAYRSYFLDQQGYRCALCEDEIIDDAVLDHDHNTGQIRRVLHRGCNALLGKVENNLKRNRMTDERFESWAKNLIEYIKTSPQDLLHPTYKTKEEKQMKKKKGGGRGKGRGR